MAHLNRIAVDDEPKDKDIVPGDQECELALLRTDLRDAIDELGWKHDALAVVLSERTGLAIDGPYLSKMLSGDKPLSAAHLAALPDDIEAVLYRRRAERFGLIVVEPLTGLAAQKALVAGLIGVMSAPAGERTLPQRGEASMAKASLEERVARKVVGR